jgi:hypothetical protein
MRSRIDHAGGVYGGVFITTFAILLPLSPVHVSLRCADAIRRISNPSRARRQVFDRCRPPPRPGAFVSIGSGLSGKLENCWSDPNRSSWTSTASLTVFSPGHAAKAEENSKSCPNICGTNCCRTDFRVQRKSHQRESRWLESRVNRYRRSRSLA